LDTTNTEKLIGVTQAGYIEYDMLCPQPQMEKHFVNSSRATTKPHPIDILHCLLDHKNKKKNMVS